MKNIAFTQFKSLNDHEINHNLSNILKILSKNKINKDILVTNNGEIVHNLITILLTEEKNENNIINLEILNNLINHNVKKLVNSNIVGENDLNIISLKYSENDAGIKLKEILNPNHKEQKNNDYEFVTIFIILE